MLATFGHSHGHIHDHDHDHDDDHHRELGLRPASMGRDGELGSFRFYSLEGGNEVRGGLA